MATRFLVSTILTNLKTRWPFFIFEIMKKDYIFTNKGYTYYCIEK